MIAIISAEIYLIIDYKNREKIVGNVKGNNVFYTATVNEAYDDNLWKERWRIYKPNSSIKIKTNNGDIHSVEINEHGFRTDSFSIKKPDNIIRIISIGASTTVQGSTNKKTYPAHMKAILKEKFPNKNIEVLNFGISGTHSNHWLNKIDELLSYQPDIVIQYNAINDISSLVMDQYIKNNPNVVRNSKSLLYQKLFLFKDESFDQLLNNFNQLNTLLSENGIIYISGSFAMPSYETGTLEQQHLLDMDSQVWGHKIGLRYYFLLYNFMQNYNQVFKDFVIEKNINHVLVDENIYHPDFFIDGCHMNDLGIQEMASVFSTKIIKELESTTLTTKPNILN